MMSRSQRGGEEMSKNKSSVEQLVNSLIKLGYLHSNGFGQSLKVTEVINQAKELHKKEIEEAHFAPKYGCFSEQYYNETFEK